jgi:hypothetical protein
VRIAQAIDENVHEPNDILLPTGLTGSALMDETIQRAESGLR